jgi:ribonucleoside-diphosphate reductase beta chain
MNIYIYIYSKSLSRHMNTNKTNNVESADYTEHILQENPNRFVVFPIQYNDIWEAFQTHRKAMWVESEIDLTTDQNDWSNLNDNEKHFIKNVLAFFAASDGIVLENLSVRFANEVQYPEARCFYSIQTFMETIHSIMYSQLIETYITDNAEKMKVFRSIENTPAIKKKADWAMNWISSDTSFATRLIAFAIVEGVFFSGSFCCIYWLNESGRMPGLCKSNDFIARDEGMHTDFACLLYRKYITKKLTDSEVHTIFKDAVAIEMEFITESLPCSLLGMNSKLMCEYIKFVANRLVLQLGHTSLYPDAKQPFSFMDRICLENKTNFFEGRVSEYQMQMTATNLNELSFNDF